jgi:alkylation response protein AidB-like acyl-CoA dehydrogenase
MTNEIKGGSFLVNNISYDQIFIPEEFSDDQKMVLDMVADFVKSSVMPVTAQIEGLDIELTKKLIEEAGQLGILGTSFPEEFGGSDQDFVTNIKLGELMAQTRSFSLSIGANTGIGMLPISYFGTQAQKEKYLPDLISGKIKAAYCLTEPGSGSDALAAKTKAVLNPEGTHYVLNGQKMWITNAGFADVFVVFAKIDGEKFTGFIVERAWPGVSTAAEEKKLGIKGSSTRQVFFENVLVPIENLLGEIGKGHKIAFNILNIGRIKLGAGVVGGSKLCFNHAVEYANTRKQFNQTISNFGAIKFKIGEMATRIFANESALYRASGDIDNKERALLEAGKSYSESVLGAAEEFAIECALMKVHNSECLDYAADEGLQIYGGMGYSEEAPMASAYRDARINRIFEGTNEINRMLAVDMLFKRALKGEIDLMTPGMAIQKELMGMPAMQTPDGSPLGEELIALENLKKAVLMVAGSTVQKFMMEIEGEQEILMDISDMLADVYLMESSILRTQKLLSKAPSEKLTRLYVDMTKVFCASANDRITQKGKSCITSWAEGDTRKTLLMGLKRYTKYEGINCKDARRRIAEFFCQENGYFID